MAALLLVLPATRVVLAVGVGTGSRLTRSVPEAIVV